MKNVCDLIWKVRTSNYEKSLLFCVQWQLKCKFMYREWCISMENIPTTTISSHHFIWMTIACQWCCLRHQFHTIPKSYLAITFTRKSTGSLLSELPIWSRNIIYFNIPLLFLLEFPWTSKKLILFYKFYSKIEYWSKSVVQFMSTLVIIVQISAKRCCRSDPLKHGRMSLPCAAIAGYCWYLAFHFFIRLCASFNRSLFGWKH
jgi:hypothetical protein